MSNIIDVISRLTRPYYYRIIVFVIFILFVVIGYYGYKSITTKQKNKFADVANADRRNKEALIYFFHVDWCPHCKKALPEWKNFASKYDGKEINGYFVKCIDKDCTKETSDITVLINRFNIDSYPTVKMVRDGTTVDFDSKITSSSLEKFANTMLN
jgi:thiol-disulfide isomerase/thioredoxin